MKRGQFLRSLFTGAAIITTAPQLLSNEPKLIDKFLFDDLFIISKGNDRLIYPKKESLVYKKIEETFKNRVNKDAVATYLPVHHLSIPVKKEYSFDDFMPVQFYFECVYAYREKYTTESHDVCFRFIKDKPDRMHLQVFIDNRYQKLDS